MKHRSVRTGLALMTCLLLGTSLAHAQATRTWVSGVGDDANPCSRTAPCKTFAGAISKTAAGGEISVLDPGGFGAVTITKSITINGDGTLAGILASLTNGVIVNAGANDVVTLRNISINGGGNGLNGIRFLNGAMLIVDKVSISGFTGSGIDADISSNAALIVSDSSIRGGATGIRADANALRLDTSINNVAFRGSVNGLDTQGASSFANVSNSIFTKSNGIAVFAEGGAINLENSEVSGNGIGLQPQLGANIRITNNGFYDNQTGFACGTGGTLTSAGNNRKANNTGGVTPACTPTVIITLQ
jgi:hypothetical protein